MSSRSRWRRPFCAVAPAGSPRSASEQCRHKLFMVSGHVNRPCTSRMPWASLPRADRASLRRHSRRLGQPARRHSGGSSCPVVKAEHIIDAPMDFDGMRDVKSSFGTAAVIVMDKSTDIIKAIWRLAAFYKHESCGQCTPCREGTRWMMRVMERMVQGRAQSAKSTCCSTDEAGGRPHDLRARRCRRLPIQV